MKLLVRSALWIGLILAAMPAYADDLDSLARDFWAWRANEMPISGDDIPRLQRPADWTGDWSSMAVARNRKDLRGFEVRWQKIDVSHAPIPRQVDYRLMGSAIARVRWELEITRGWQRNPWFYVDQTLGSVFLLLLPPPPFDETRSRSIIRALEQFPNRVADAKANLTDARAQWAVLAIDELSDVRAKLSTVARELKPFLAPESAAKLDAATEKAIAALEDYHAWLEKRLPGMGKHVAVGRAGYEFFLKHVALIPYSPEQLVAMARQEWQRAVTFEVYEANRNANLPELPLFKDQATQMAAEEQRENEIRRFLEEKNILTVPAWMKHYRNLPLPKYVEPLRALGVTDDLTGPNRLDQDGVSYIPVPGPKLGYFSAATARDPRPIIVHEGVPGHYYQLARSWQQPNLIRRHYYDSSANEGIGLYGEEMMLQAGQFDDSPRTREIIYNFMRLRALRVEVDVKLALREFTIEQAADYFVKNVPMDRETALSESAFYASDPGLAIAYQTGKLQIIKMLAEAKRMKGNGFSLREFHDFVWTNGNVPFSLQRWEYLGLDDEIKRLDARPAKATK